MKKSKWHKFPDELPVYYRTVLFRVIDEKGNYFTFMGHLEFGGWVINSNYIPKNLTVTHWRELPKPPKE